MANCKTFKNGTDINCIIDDIQVKYRKTIFYSLKGGVSITVLKTSEQDWEVGKEYLVEIDGLQSQLLKLNDKQEFIDIDCAITVRLVFGDCSDEINFRIDGLVGNTNRVYRWVKTIFKGLGLK